MSTPFLRYLVVGGASFAVDLTVFLLMVRHFGVSPQTSQIVSRTAGALFGFGGHKYFSFANHGRVARHSTRAQAMGYVAIAVGGILLSPIVLSGMLAITSVLSMAKVLNEIVMVCINFVVLRALFSYQSDSTLRREHE
jgi:putative flippase GtrA